MHGHERVRATARVMGVAILLTVGACGGGGGSSTAALETGSGLTGFTPDGVMPSETPQDFVITGFGFAPVGEAGSVRLLALEGTPFAMGSAAVLEAQGVIEDEATITGTFEAAMVSPGTGEVAALLEVELPDGTLLSLDGHLARFAALEYELVLTSVTPISGVTTGGQAVRIEGSGFAQYDPGLPEVHFGEWQASEVEVHSDTVMTCLTPAAGLGTVDVRVTNAYATAVLEQAFTFSWTPLWDWEYGPLVVKLSEHEHLYTHDLLAQDFSFPFYGEPCGRVALFCGWLSLYDAVSDAWLGDVHPLGDCLDTHGEAAAVHLKQLEDRVVLTYKQVGWAHDEEGVATCQVTFHESGAFAVLWREVVPSPMMLVSVFPAGSDGGDLPVDWSGEPEDPAGLGMFESFDAVNPFDLAYQGLLFRPQAMGGYATTRLTLEALEP